MRLQELLTEDEYSAVQSQLGQNPYAQKVDASQAGYTTGSGLKYMTTREKTEWAKRQQQLQSRVESIYTRLVSSMPANERAALKGVTIEVPLNGELAWAAANYADRKITVDVGAFWDLSNDCIAYTIGHEIGHIVYESRHPGYWKKEQTPAQQNKREMDADVYGALLAYKLGYDMRKAWDHFTIAYQREPFDPKYPEYPSVPQRKRNVQKAIGAQQLGQPQQPEPQQPTSAADTKKNMALNHIMYGLQKFQAALPSLSGSTIA
jgi:hypothetical protein